MEVLFESRLEIENIAGKLRAIQSQPQYHPEVVVPRDTFVDRAGTSIWGTVLKDGGRYRMWYQPWPEDWDGRDVSLFGWDTGVFGSTAISLTYQEERGACWQHAPGRPDFLTPGGYYLSSTTVEVGDEHWLYFAGDPTAYGWYLDAEWNRLDHRMAELVELGLSEIGLARFPKFRLFGFESVPEGVLTLDLGPLAAPCELVLTCKIFHDGCIRVELLDDGIRSARLRNRLQETV